MTRSVFLPLFKYFKYNIYTHAGSRDSKVEDYRKHLCSVIGTAESVNFIISQINPVVWDFKEGPEEGTSCQLCKAFIRENFCHPIIELF